MRNLTEIKLESLTTDFNQVLREKSWPSNFTVIAGLNFKFSTLKMC